MDPYGCTPILVHVDENMATTCSYGPQIKRTTTVVMILFGRLPSYLGSFFLSVLSSSRACPA